MRHRLGSGLIAAGAALVAACTGGGEQPAAADLHLEAHDVHLVDVPPISDDAPGLPDGTSAESDSAPSKPPTGPAADVDLEVAAIGEYGHLGSLTDTGVDDVWVKWQARPSLDGQVAVMSLRDETATTISPPQTPLSWVTLPDTVETDELKLDGFVGHVDAVSQTGEFVALTNFAAPPNEGEIAGAKESTSLVIADRDGIRYEVDLDGNFIAEAFGRTAGVDGLPTQVFLLEHIPADAPRFYRVRVLDTSSGEVSLPLNIRDKTQQVDERMSGLSRSQVIADEFGLLFTLYRGTIDGTPDGEPYAFVHTLDLANGVWCLFLDPALDLDSEPGAIAVGGDRLYIASANGKVGSIRIPSINDLAAPPEVDWVTQVGMAQRTAPILLADDDGVWVGLADGTNVLRRLDDEGYAHQRKVIEGWNPTALAYDRNGDVVAAAAGWSTLGNPRLPDWFGDPAGLYTG